MLTRSKCGPCSVCVLGDVRRCVAVWLGLSLCDPHPTRLTPGPFPVRQGKVSAIQRFVTLFGLQVVPGVPASCWGKGAAALCFWKGRTLIKGVEVLQRCVPAVTPSFSQTQALYWLHLALSQCMMLALCGWMGRARDVPSSPEAVPDHRPQGAVRRQSWLFQSTDIPHREGQVEWARVRVRAYIRAELCACLRAC